VPSRYLATFLPYTTLTAFKKRILENGKLKAYERLFKQIIAIALEKGIKFGSIQVVDSVHTVADVNVEKDERRRREGKPPRDGSARWGAKGKKVVRDEKGRRRKERLYFYGYKEHVSFNAQTGLITSIRASPGSAYDGHYLPTLIQSDLEQGIPVRVVAADRGYDDGENHEFLREKGIDSAIHLNSYRTQKRDKNKEIWAKLKGSPSYQRGIRERKKIEGKFGEMKKHHGFGRCRYLGLLRYWIQCYLTAIAVNLKRIVKILTGVGLKGPKRSCLAVS
jgi:IS5 family transposase